MLMPFEFDPKPLKTLFEKTLGDLLLSKNELAVLDSSYSFLEAVQSSSETSSLL